MPGIVNRPSPCVTPSYEVPDGWCTAVIVAPGMTPPEASLTMPVIEAVVTCADDGAATARTAHTSRPTTCFIDLSCRNLEPIDVAPIVSPYTTKPARFRAPAP